MPQTFQLTGFRLKRNHSNALPRYILALSVESKREQADVSGRLHNHEFVSATVVSGRLANGKIVGRKSYKFTDTDELWKHIFAYTKPNYTTWLVGHAVLTKLILCGVAYKFQCGELSIDRPRAKRTRENNDEDDPHTSALAVLENPPTIIGCRVGETQGRLVIVDLLNWFRGELSTIQAACGFETAADTVGGNKDDNPGCTQEREANSIHQCFEGLIHFVNDNQLGMFRYTASGQAMGAYRHRFMQHQIYLHDNLPVMRQERKAYFGGRSDVFRKGMIDETVYQYDVNALFPSVMRGGFFPTSLNRFETRPHCIELLPSIDWSASVAEVVIESRKPLYPVRTDEHIIYPTGTFKTNLCGMELYRAFKSGIIRRVGSWSEYTLAPIFTLWVDELWGMRQEFKRTGNLLYEQLVKQLMNALYGKFGQLTPSWVNRNSDYSMLPFTTESRRDCSTGAYRTFRSVGWQVQELQARSERQGSFYAISAFVTAAARIRMDYLRTIAGRRNVLYQGVDSLIATAEGRDSLVSCGEVSETEIGKLKLERTADYGAIRGISDYEIGTHVVLAGCAKNATTTEYGEVLQHRQYVADHLFKNGPIDNILEKTEAWIRQNDYAKGVVQPDGWITPFVLGEPINAASDGSLEDVAALSAREP